VFGWRSYSAPWMSLKTRTVLGRSPPRRAPAHRPRLRVLPLLVASKASHRTARSFCTVGRALARGSGHLGVCRKHEAAASAAADLTTLATGIARFVGRPLVGCPLLVCGAPALAGDLALLFRRHRSESATFFTFSCTHRSLRLSSVTNALTGPHTDPSGPAAAGDPALAGDAARRAASPALRPGPCHVRPACRGWG
jgi:hypothetical protein